MSDALQVFSGVMQSSFAQRDAARGDQVPTYKAKENQTDRIAVLDASVLGVALVHSDFSEDKNKKGLGYVLCKSTYKRQGDLEVPDKIADCCKLLPEARKRAGTVVIKYATDNKGKPLAKAPGDVTYQVLAWVFSSTVFETLFTVNDEYAKRDGETITEQGLNLVDLLITCEDAEWQRLKIVPSPTRIRNMPDFKAKYDQNIQEVLDAFKTKIPRLIGREVTDQELQTKAGAGFTNSVSVKPQEAPSDIAQLFG